ncbi:hypothetical protein BD289DRAFT_479634 [Coniella lustricola]|uniref:Uncharacterized protein n=1 Tax=Coniella lustricola TaxID=2025994 RepID=A0A2T3AIH7_9PEZI|nr:hypothetical protein BD289DRAFT_479634 [Coniella lustricola]
MSHGPAFPLSQLALCRNNNILGTTCLGSHTGNWDLGPDQDFRAYTEPLSSSSATNNLNPPSIPPPPPPPPPLNIPPSRARMAFAARLASKRKAEEGGSGDAEDEHESGPGQGDMSSMLMQGEGGEGELKNPFADDEDDDEEGSGEGSDEGSDDGDLGAGSSEAAAGSGAEVSGGGGGGSAWNRGGWWRGALGNRKNKPAEEHEKFGDGRDSSSDEEMNDADVGGGDGGRDGGNSSEEDEEFGDFALPEGQGDDGSGNTEDENSNMLVKPLPLHPSGGATAAVSGSGTASGNKGLMGLWPFTKKDKDASTGNTSVSPTEVEKVGGSGETGEAGEESAEKADATAAAAAATADDKTSHVVLSEDGEKVQGTVEAKRRTSIEEPDEGEDEVVV